MKADNLFYTFVVCAVCLLFCMGCSEVAHQSSSKADYKVFHGTVDKISQQTHQQKFVIEIRFIENHTALEVYSDEPLIYNYQHGDEIYVTYYPSGCYNFYLDRIETPETYKERRYQEIKNKETTE